MHLVIVMSQASLSKILFKIRNRGELSFGEGQYDCSQATLMVEHEAEYGLAESSYM